MWVQSTLLGLQVNYVVNLSGHRCSAPCCMNSAFTDWQIGHGSKPMDFSHDRTMLALVGVFEEAGGTRHFRQLLGLQRRAGVLHHVEEPSLTH